jgi:hypothetical protein
MFTGKTASSRVEKSAVWRPKTRRQSRKLNAKASTPLTTATMRNKVNDAGKIACNPTSGKK